MEVLVGAGEREVGVGELREREGGNGRGSGRKGQLTASCRARMVGRAAGSARGAARSTVPASRAAPS